MLACRPRARGPPERPPPRLAIFLFVAEKLFKLVRAPGSRREVPVPVEAAAVAFVLNFAFEYGVVWCGCLVPATLAKSFGGAPVEIATAYLTVICWRILYAATAGTES